MATIGDGVAKVTIHVDRHDLSSLLCSDKRDFLVRNNGEQVKCDSLKGKKIGLYFSASWCGPCQRFTPILAEAYDGLSDKFEIVFISADDDDESFKDYFSKMPWLALPFYNSEVRNRLDEVFNVVGIPHLVILDENGEILTENGVEFVGDYGMDSYPFTPEKIKQLKELEVTAKRDQSLRSILVSQQRDYVILNDGSKVPVAELEGKTVGLYFAFSSYQSCLDFTQQLVEVYTKLTSEGESFEIVFLSLDDEEELFKQSFQSMPWCALPFKDKFCEKLVRYFELSTLPTLVIIGPNGKTLHSNVVETIQEHGALAYPFTPQKFAVFEEIEKAKQEAQTLESILVSGDLDYVIGKDGAKVPVSDLVGKNILLYFSAHWCPPCRAFLPKLIEAYHKIKERDDAFEVIFISSDRDQASFDDFFSEMPWTAVPFGDKRKAFLARAFKVNGIPMLVAIGPTGRTVTMAARDLIMTHGANAYPFTEEHMQEIEAEFKEMAKEWPERVRHGLHKEHELVLSRRWIYTCDGCEEEGRVWSYYCNECDFDLHPKCGLGEDKGRDSKEGWVCDGEACFRK